MKISGYRQAIRIRLLQHAMRFSNDLKPLAGLLRPSKHKYRMATTILFVKKEEVKNLHVKENFLRMGRA